MNGRAGHAGPVRNIADRHSLSKLDATRDRAVARLKADADRFAKNAAPIIREIQSSGVASHRGIARALNARGIATDRGGEWTALQVGAILQRTGHLLDTGS